MSIQICRSPSVLACVESFGLIACRKVVARPLQEPQLSLWFVNQHDIRYLAANYSSRTDRKGKFTRTNAR